ncbi:hypothetical protein J2783_002349 [Chryseobacterium sediminis]|nr:hypothetical protein [Chryseobacterium sediminis]
MKNSDFEYEFITVDENFLNFLHSLNQLFMKNFIFFLKIYARFLKIGIYIDEYSKIINV